jgi:hypothetical protein
MIVEAAMRQAGGAHQIGDGDGLEALLAKQRVGGFHNLAAVLLGLLAGDAHRAFLRLTMMICIIIK